MCLDYGGKRTGVAVTDPLQIIVTGLDTVETNLLFKFFETYLKTETVDKLVLGYPTHADGNPTYLVEQIEKFVKTFKQLYPLIIIDYIDESYSSAEAKEIIFNSGVKKKKRMDKSLVDKVSAILLLQKYLKHI
jgi:putative Holliday junction resolvase